MGNDQILRSALKANGAFSILSAFIAFAFASSVLAVNEMAGGNGFVFAVQLVVFGSFVLFNAFRRSVSKIMIIIIIILDGLYVLQSIAIILSRWAYYSVGGLALLILTTIAVAGFGYFQVIGLNKFLKDR